jgi:hypothetical protein
MLEANLPEMSLYDFPDDSPEIKLIKAVILRAWQDARGGRVDIQQHHTRQARVWFRSRSKAPFSFKWCCIQLEQEKKIALAQDP